MNLQILNSYTTLPWKRPRVQIGSNVVSEYFLEAKAFKSPSVMFQAKSPLRQMRLKLVRAPQLN